MKDDNEGVLKTTKPKEPKLVFRPFNKYIVLGVELVDGWIQPIRRLVRERSKYVPHQGEHEKSRRRLRYK